MSDIPNEDPWDTVASDSGSGDRQAPYLSADDGIGGFAQTDSGATGISHEEGRPTGGDDVETGVTGKNSQKARKPKGPKAPMSTAKIALMGGGGLIVVTLAGATGFWFMTQHATAPAAYTQTSGQNSQSANDALNGAVPLPGAPGQRPLQRSDMVATSPAPSAGMPSAGSQSAQPIGIDNAGTGVVAQPIPPVTSVSPASSAAGAQAPSSMDSTALSTAMTTSALAQSSGESTASATSAQADLAGHRNQVKQLMAEVAHLKADIRSENRSMAAMKVAQAAPASASPKVIYRTIIRYVQQRTSLPRISRPVAPAAAQGLPSGYVVVGGGGNSALVRTPSGRYRTIRAGDTVNGQVVQSVHDGQVQVGR